MSNYAEYSKYLQRRSALGSIYRNHILYPRIEPLLAGYVLDIGCGIGDMLKYYGTAVGVDINPYNVAFCRARGLRVTIMPFDQIPFDSQTFDSALLDNVLEHMVDPAKLISEISRVLKPNGLLVIGVPGLKGQAADFDHKTYYNEIALEALAEKSGFRVNKYMYAPFCRSAFLNRTLTQYSIYTQWQKIE